MFSEDAENATQRLPTFSRPKVPLELLEDVRPSALPTPQGGYRDHFSPVCAEPLFKRLENRRVGIGLRKAPRRLETMIEGR